MKIDIVKVGELECNCYLLEINDKILLIDPGDDANKIIKLIGGRDVVGIIVTHYHFDHIGALEELINKYNVSVHDRYNMSEGMNKIDDFSFDVIYTPGHKEDLITLYFKEDKCMFCGDFIFKESIGRCDLPGGSVRKMKESISKIKTYDKNIVIYPGHGDRTTLGYEISNNIYFRDANII